MQAEAAATFVYDALPGLTLAFSPEEALDSGAEPRSTSPAAAPRQGEDDAAATYAVFRNEITAAGDVLADIPAADFFSLDVSAFEAEPASPQETVPAAAVNSTPSSSRAAEQPAQGSERAWFRGKRFRSPMMQLHKEILDFCDFISPSTEEQSSRMAAVQAVSDVIKHIWPQCKVEVFGSFRTGLYLPTSDIDVVIFESRVKPQLGLYALAKALTQKGVAKKIQVISKARVPIVKFVETSSGISFDVSFDVDGGPQAADFIKDAVKKMPALRPLCMILKVFLLQRELNEVYTGGIGSYALLAMLITHLKLVWGAKDILGYCQSKEHNLGILLVKFFDFYGRKLNHWDVGISCNSMRTFFLKRDKDFVNLDRPHLLAIQDPMAPDNDIGRSSFNYFKVRSAFSKAYSVLTDTNLITSLGPNRSILGTIVRPDSVLLDRKGWNNEDTLADMLTEPWEPMTQRFDSENDAVYNWHIIDDEPLPRNSPSTSEDASSSPLQKRKSKSNQKSRKKSKANGSGSDNVSNGSVEKSARKRDKGLVHGARSHHRTGSGKKRRKGQGEYDRFTNLLPQYSHVSKW